MDALELLNLVVSILASGVGLYLVLRQDFLKKSFSDYVIYTSGFGAKVRFDAKVRPPRSRQDAARGGSARLRGRASVNFTTALP